MTISTTYAPIQYNGNSVTTTFAFPYVFFESSNLLVTLTLISTGANDPQVLDTDYSVTGGNGDTGSITFMSAPATGYRVTIELDLPYTQEDDYVENQAFPAETIESGFDRAAIRDQQLVNAAERSLKFPATLSGSLVGLLPQPVDGELLIWDGITGQVANASLADISISLNTIITSPTSGQVLTWNGTNWVNAAITIPDGSITTAKIGDDQVTAAKIADGAIDNAAKVSDFVLGYYKMDTAAIASTANIISGTVAKLVAAASLAPLYYGCKTYQTTGTSVATGTWTSILFDTEAWDDSTWHSTSSNTERHTFDFSGRVSVVASYASNATDNASYGVRILKNGTVVARAFESSGAGSAEVTQIPLSVELDVVATDYIEMQAYQSSGSSKTTQTGLSGTSLSSKRIR